MLRREASLVDAAPVFAALGDATRLRVVAKLCAEGPQSISRLTQDATITRQGVAKHLRVLEQAGVVRSCRHGRENVYELWPHRLTEAKLLLAQIEGQWEDALLRLRDFVEGDAGEHDGR